MHNGDPPDGPYLICFPNPPREKGMDAYVDVLGDLHSTPDHTYGWERVEDVLQAIKHRQPSYPGRGLVIVRKVAHTTYTIEEVDIQDRLAKEDRNWSKKV